MAYLSGYAGSVTFTGTQGAVIYNPPATDIKVTRWEIDQETDTHEAKAKGDDWVETFAMASRFRGRLGFLLLAGSAVAGGSMEIRTAGSVGKTIAFVLVAKAGTEFTGAGFLTAMSTACPLDGPVEHTVSFIGNGALTFAGAA